MTDAVADSTVLVYLAKLGELGHLREQFETVLVPEAVYAETVERGRVEGYADALAIDEATGTFLEVSGLSAGDGAVACMRNSEISGPRTSGMTDPTADDEPITIDDTIEIHVESDLPDPTSEAFIDEVEELVADAMQEHRDAFVELEDRLEQLTQQSVHIAVVERVLLEYGLTDDRLERVLSTIVEVDEQFRDRG